MPRRQRANNNQRIDETLRGQTASFGELVTKYQDRLYNSVLHVIGSADEAYDVVQDAFALVKLDTFCARLGCVLHLAVPYRFKFWPSAAARRQRPVVSVEQKSKEN